MSRMYTRRLLLYLGLVIHSSLVFGDCPGKADIVYVVPGNLNIPTEEFLPFETFLTILSDYFVIDYDNANFGLILYGREPIAIGYPQPFRDQTMINTRITLLSQREAYMERLNGIPDVEAAINLMRQMFRDPTGYPSSEPRPGVNKIGVVFTYGKVSDDKIQSIVNAANQAKAEGITIYVVGSGDVGPEFNSIGSSNCQMFSMDSFMTGLPSLLPYLGSSICTVLDGTVNATDDNCFPKFWQPSPNPPVICHTLDAIFQDPYNCAYYFKCDLSNIPRRERCPVTMLFDNKIKTCNYKEHVTCYSNLTCPSASGLFPHPQDCTKFLNCFQGTPYLQQCPTRLVYNAKREECEKRTLTNCQVN